QGAVQRALRRLADAAALGRARLRDVAGAARLHHLDGGAHADAGHAAHLLLLPAVAAALRLHVSLSRHAAMGTDARRDLPPPRFSAGLGPRPCEGAPLSRRSAWGPPPW